MNDCHLEISTELGLQVNSISPISYLLSPISYLLSPISYLLSPISYLLSLISLLFHFYLPLASFVFPSRLTLHSSHFLDFCAFI